MSTRRNGGRHRAAPEPAAHRRHRRPPGGRHARPPSRVRRRVAVVAAVAAVVSAGSGAAMAAWAAQGEGQAEAMAMGAQAIVVDDQAAPVADLYPGGTGDVVLRVRNPNPYAVTLTSVQYGTITGGCAAGSVTAVQSTVTLTTPLQLPAGSPAQTVTFPDAVRMSPTAPDACQNATFSVPVTLSGTSS